MTTYRIEINRRVVDPYDEDGEWMEGDTREISAQSPDIHTMDGKELHMHGYSSLAGWALHVLGKGWEPSQYPVPDHVRESAWMSQSYDDPYTTSIEETTVRLTTGWTETQRSVVFRMCSKNV